MKKVWEKRITLGAREIALIGLMAATLECGKLVLSALPNIEVVTLLCALYGYVFGPYGVMAAAVFVCIEPLIWGFGSWIITYIVYWPSVALVFMLLKRRGVTRRLPLTAVAVGMTVAFGLVSSVVDSAFYLGINEHYFKNLVIYYLRGLPFYIAQIVTGAALFPTLFPLLSSRLGRISDKIFSPREQKNQ